jgi:hypothetical protein
MSGRRKIQLGESWVVEGDDSAEENAESEDIQQLVSSTTARQRLGRGQRSPDPEFIMPSPDASTTDGSYFESPSRGVRARRTRASSVRSRQEQGRQSQVLNEQRSKPKKLTKQRPQDDRDAVETIVHHALAILSWSIDVLGSALRILKTPISYLLAIWLLFGIGIILRNLVTHSIYASLSPICRIPGTSLLNLPFCPGSGYSNNAGPAPPVEFDQLMTVQGKFEEVLEETAGGVSLPVDMKRGEASIRDLRQLVKYSQLNSR